MLVPVAKRYFIRLLSLSLRYQPPILIALEVVFFSSIQSEATSWECASTSLMTIASGLGIMPESSQPGEPLMYALARQLSFLPQSFISESDGLIMVSE